MRLTGRRFTEEGSTNQSINPRASDLLLVGIERAVRGVLRRRGSLLPRSRAATDSRDAARPNPGCSAHLRCIALFAPVSLRLRQAETSSTIHRSCVAFEPLVDLMNLWPQPPRVEAGTCVPSCGASELSRSAGERSSCSSWSLSVWGSPIPGKEARSFRLRFARGRLRPRRQPRLGQRSPLG